MTRGVVKYRIREWLDREGVAKTLGMAPEEANKLFALPSFPKPEHGGKYERNAVEHFIAARKAKRRPAMRGF